MDQHTKSAPLEKTQETSAKPNVNTTKEKLISSVYPIVLFIGLAFGLGGLHGSWFLQIVCAISAFIIWKWSYRRSNEAISLFHLGTAIYLGSIVFGHLLYVSTHSAHINHYIPGLLASLSLMGGTLALLRTCYHIESSLEVRGIFRKVVIALSIPLAWSFIDCSALSAKTFNYILLVLSIITFLLFYQGVKELVKLLEAKGLHEYKLVKREDKPGKRSMLGIIVGVAILSIVVHLAIVAVMSMI